MSWFLKVIITKIVHALILALARGLLCQHLQPMIIAEPTWPSKYPKGKSTVLI